MLADILRPNVSARAHIKKNIMAFIVCSWTIGLYKSPLALWYDFFFNTTHTDAVPNEIPGTCITVSDSE